MSGRRNAARHLYTWLAGAMLTAVAAVPPGWAQSAQPAAAGSRLRAADSKAAALLATGAAHSATFRRIAGAIERTDLIVYVETVPIKVPGRLQFLTATAVCRHVRISIRVPGLDAELIAWLAHELWHALEVAAAPEVRDQASLLLLYRRIGVGGRYSTEVESLAAQDVGTKVLCELRGVR